MSLTKLTFVSTTIFFWELSNYSPSLYFSCAKFPHSPLLSNSSNVNPVLWPATVICTFMDVLSLRRLFKLLKLAAWKFFFSSRKFKKDSLGKKCRRSGANYFALKSFSKLQLILSICKFLSFSLKLRLFLSFTIKLRMISISHSLFLSRFNFSLYPFFLYHWHFIIVYFCLRPSAKDQGITWVVVVVVLVVVLHLVHFLI